MSSSAEPITEARFTAALASLSVPSLHAKAAEIHNSIAHLQDSNAQLAPFAGVISTLQPGASINVFGARQSEGGTRMFAAGTHQSPETLAHPDLVFDQECADALEENELVIERMRTRLAILRTEVEDRGEVWPWGRLDEMVAEKVSDARIARYERRRTDGVVNGTEHPAANGTRRTDGAADGARIEDGEATEDATLQADADQSGGAAHNAISFEEQRAQHEGHIGGSGTLSDEELRRRMQEQMDDLGNDDEDEGDGVHL